MDCTDVRERIEADPAELEQEAAAHIELCAACGAYAERARDAERLIHEALRFDVASLKQNAATARGRTFARQRRLWGGVAAAVIAGVAVWVGVSTGPDLDGSSLVAEVAAHWYEEPQSWVQTDVQVSSASLENVVNGRASIDTSRLGSLSYAQSCFVRGAWVPHLVLQGERGPVMLLLLPHESVSEPLPLTLPEEGLSGVIMPLGQGSIAVMGEDGEPIEPIRERLVDAVEWSI